MGLDKRYSQSPGCAQCSCKQGKRRFRAEKANTGQLKSFASVCIVGSLGLSTEAALEADVLRKRLRGERRSQLLSKGPAVLWSRESALIYSNQMLMPFCNSQLPGAY